MTAPAPFLRTETILDRILTHKASELAAQQQHEPIHHLRAEAEAAPPPLDFLRHLRQGQHLAIIAECKRASPSAGVIRADIDPATLALRYQTGGASAISVLTDGEFFQGSLADLRAVRAAISLPILRKDFLIDPYQLYQARAAGADAILLIVAALADEPLRDLLLLAGELALAPLVEIHDERELERALRCGASLIGINNRDLRTFTTDLMTTTRLARLLPPGITLVAESGIRERADIAAMARAGAHAVLVGETLMRAPNLAETLGEFASVPRP